MRSENQTMRSHHTIPNQERKRQRRLTGLLRPSPRKIQPSAAALGNIGTTRNTTAQVFSASRYPSGSLHRPTVKMILVVMWASAKIEEGRRLLVASGHRHTR